MNLLEMFQLPVACFSLWMYKSKIIKKQYKVSTGMIHISPKASVSSLNKISLSYLSSNNPMHSIIKAYHDKTNRKLIVFIYLFFNLNLWIHSSAVGVGFYGNSETNDGVYQLTYSLSNANHTLGGINNLVSKACQALYKLPSYQHHKHENLFFIFISYN